MSETTVAAETAPVLHGEAILREIRASGIAYALMLPDVVDDGAQVLDWIVRQPWSNGKVGATGISGVGMTAQ